MTKTRTFLRTGTREPIFKMIMIAFVFVHKEFLLLHKTKKKMRFALHKNYDAITWKHLITFSRTFASLGLMNKDFLNKVITFKLNSNVDVYRNE